MLISQSSVSAAIKTLELEFEVKLIKRRETNYDNMALTEAGKCFYFYAKEILNSKEKLYNDIEILKRKGEKSLRDSISIITNGALGSYLLLILTKRFKSNFDKLNLKIIIENDYSVITNLFKNNTCDIGIIPRDVDTPFTDLVFTFEQRMSIVANKKISISSYQELEKLPLVLLPESFFVRKMLDDFFLNNKISPNIIMELNFPYVIKELIKNENFVTILHYAIVKEEIRRGELIEIIPSFKLPFITYKLVVNQKSTKNKYLNEITNFLAILKNDFVV